MQYVPWVSISSSPNRLRLAGGCGAVCMEPLQGKRVATNEVHVYVLATAMLDNLSDASDYWTMTDKVTANTSDGHCSARMTVNPFNSSDCLANLNRSGSC